MVTQAKFACGLSVAPGAVSSLASRLVCAKCFVQPQIKSANADANTGAVSFTVSCHGKSASYSVTSKSDLLRIFKCFQEDAVTENEDDDE